MADPEKLGQGRALRSNIDFDSATGARDPIEPPEVVELDAEKKPWDVSECECDLPDLEVSKGSVGVFEIQILSCEACQYVFGFTYDLKDDE